MSEDTACSNCGTDKPEHRVELRSFDMDLPPIRLCVICTHLIWTDPETFKAMRKQ